MKNRFSNGSKKFNVNSLTLYERKTKISMGIKIYGKGNKTITKALLHLRGTNKLIYDINIKSIITNNGSEFYDWKKSKNLLATTMMILMFISIIYIVLEKKVC